MRYRKVAYVPIDLNEDNAVLIIQTNDGLSTANSYVSEAELESYTTGRGITLTKSLSQSLLRAMDYLESKQYKSEPLNTTQSTLFPRLGVGVPRAIKTAQILLAINADTAIPVTETPVAAIRKEKVDVIEVEYFEPVSSQSALLTMVDDLLKPYLAGLSVSPNFRVYRG